jgi:CheY-like chemotaxis protein
MADAPVAGLRGKRFLVVEDEYIIARELADALEQLGAEVVGPVGSVQAALDLVTKQGEHLDGAVLDINLRGDRAYPVADALMARGVAFVLATGYDASAIPPAYAGAPRCEKPVDTALLARLLLRQIAR